MRLLRAGRTGLLVETDDAAQRRSLHRGLVANPPDGVVDIVPAQTTVLVTVDDPELLEGVAGRVRELVRRGPDEETVEVPRPVRVPVRYDGEDLADVAEVLGMSVPELVARHSGQVWTVEFAGFMPGFGYMSGPDWPYRLPRRRSPRTRIPPGSIALADGFTGAYPQASPGGWQLIATTSMTLWDETRTPPAVLAPGTTVEFMEES